jgi:K(+)-stimulated pyrophosphate-energized sodium pump
MKKTKLLICAMLFLLLPVLGVMAESEAGGQMGMMWVTWIGSVAALVFALILALMILKKDPGNEKTRSISKHVQEGALAYIKQQYKIVVIFFVFVFALFLVLSFVLGLISRFVPFAFITGGFFSGLAGYIGMTVATRSNARTAWAAQTSLNSALRIAFSSGTVMGMVVVGLGLLDLSIWWLVLTLFDLPPAEIPPIMITFGMGASSFALFARVGGGIYTKAADVGADLVGKVEAGIPEDDPRNPAVIADNVGDNVGDVAGMGADLYESYVGSVIATMALGAIASLQLPGLTALQVIQVPVTIATIGVICSIIGTFLVRAKEDATQKVLLGSLRRGVWFSTIAIAVLSFLFIYFTIGAKFIGVWAAMIVGLVARKRHRLFHRVLHLRPLQPDSNALQRIPYRSGHHHHRRFVPRDAFHSNPRSHGSHGDPGRLLSFRRLRLSGIGSIWYWSGRCRDALHLGNHPCHRRIWTGCR